MRLLLDTHILLWLMVGSARLSEDVRGTLADRRNPAYVSVASGWEIAIKVSRGRLRLPPDLQGWLPGEIAAAGMEILPVNLDHVLGVESLPDHHRDPFDRLLIAQAMVEDMMLMTADGQFDRYDGVRLLRC